MGLFLRVLLLLLLLTLPLWVRAIRRIPNDIGRVSVWVVIVCVFLGLISYTSHVVDTFFAYPEELHYPLDSVTRNGNPYRHDTASLRCENGRRVDIYVCEDELRREWHKRSCVPYDSVFSANRTAGECLIRYLTSMAHRRDSVGMAFLQPEDIGAIEAGVYNAHLRGRGPLYWYIWGELQGVEQYLLGDSAHRGDWVDGYLRLRSGLERLPASYGFSALGSATPCYLLSICLVLGWPLTLGLLLALLGFSIWLSRRRATKVPLFGVWVLLVFLLFA